MRAAFTAAVLALALTGCGDPNTDPRDGVVVLDESNCAWGDCYDLTKVCIGPDLHVIYDEMGDDAATYVYEGSEECVR